MVFSSLMNSIAFTLCIIILAGYNHQARALNRAFFGSFGKPRPYEEGLCASLITIHGYKCQELEVTTKDGYILSVQRILEGRVKAGNVTKEPVIVQHGVMVDGATWFMNSPEQNLPMILADNGFDVWIVNTRGTKHSRKHTHLDASRPEYWSWSWDELVAHEMPAVFDLVTKETKQKIHYVGHSMGTLVGLISLAEGKWENQIKSVVLLSPIAYLSRMTTAIGLLAAKSLLGESLTVMRIAEFDPKGIPATTFVQGVCAQSGLDCNNLFTLITGENCCLDKAAFDDFMKVEPQSSSTRNLLHLAQIVRTDKISKYDYMRPHLNMLNYGHLTPPAYDLSKIPKNLPIFMSYGGTDALSDVADVKKLLSDHFHDHQADKLTVQFVSNYAHGDYMFAINAHEVVYKNVTSFLKRKF